MKTEEVISVEQRKQFIEFPVKLYKDSLHWIRPLDKDIDNVFDSGKNKAYRHGECIRWLLKNDRGEIIGRVAAFVDNKTVSKGNDQPTGGMGFFDCIDDQAAAFALFNQCKDWLQ